MHFSTITATALSVVLAGITSATELDPLPQLEAYKVPKSWRQPVAPLRIAANTWQIGTQGITALLLTGSEGAILIDGGMAQTADHVLANLGVLGLQPTDLKLILHSHAHADHVGSLAAVQRATGARIATNAESALLMARGGADDIHFGDGILYSPIQADRILHQGEEVALGNLHLRVHFIPGHTPGSMAWTWQDTINGKTTQLAYVDSLSAPGYQLINNSRYPDIVRDYQTSFERVRNLPCELLITPHATASGWVFGKTATQKTPLSCKHYADKAERQFQIQLEAERQGSAGGQ
ncbi:subclass B3 metallo-beta-lactamase [Microbulbifer sp. 2205BS26-8]|uniref:subclass B3 metallo-beta-lactamase n=1 Tax=Microbulbifer sp. 2205BS26-8 TaxID=3064386 RepID=UPI00273F020F|nr:subclass B3 metallo-beta-lactamase [Microbulbifer sp. 2205BS26-8]MDP5210147.1 subclass B3 metallo-beta-lactamase [Microbulbifer sp. 2205BS26-8]